MLFRMSSGKCQSLLKFSKYFTVPEFHEQFNSDLLIHLLSNLPVIYIVQLLHSRRIIYNLQNQDIQIWIKSFLSYENLFASRRFFRLTLACAADLKEE